MFCIERNEVLFKRPDGRVYETGFTAKGLYDAIDAYDENGTRYFKRIK